MKIDNGKEENELNDVVVRIFSLSLDMESCMHAQMMIKFDPIRNEIWAHDRGVMEMNGESIVRHSSLTGSGCCSFSSSSSFCESMFSGLCHSTTNWGERCANQLTRARRQLHLLEKRNELKNEGESNRMASTRRILFCGSHERGWERHHKSIYTSNRTTAGEEGEEEGESEKESFHAFLVAFNARSIQTHTNIFLLPRTLMMSKERVVVKKER